MYIAGDFNINTLVNRTFLSHYVHNFLNILFEFGYCNLIYKPTWVINTYVNTQLCYNKFHIVFQFIFEPIQHTLPK